MHEGIPIAMSNCDCENCESIRSARSAQGRRLLLTTKFRWLLRRTGFLILRIADLFA